MAGARLRRLLGIPDNAHGTLLATLKPTEQGKQLSARWITDARLNDAVDDPELVQRIRDSGYERVLAIVDINGEVRFHRVSADADAILGPWTPH